MAYMTREEIKAYRPNPIMKAEDMSQALSRSQARMKEHGLWSKNQVLGQRYPIGCVALEITQRCNLDCTLCYLSENSESVKDIPIEEIYKRIDQIKYHYGPGTDVQVTGGDPTLRDHVELIQIVRRIRELGMRPTLMTNGLKASRKLLEELVEAGIHDVAFHVDLTQERRPFKTEMELNKVRQIYIDRARGLPIHILFNTTVFKDNFHEIPDLIRFFRKNADVVGFASFQLQADTGRGELRERDQIITAETVWNQIQKGAEIELTHDSLQIGHKDCNRYSTALCVNGNMYNMIDDPEFITAFLQRTSELEFSSASPTKTAATVGKWALKNPDILARGLRHLAPRFWKMRKDLIASKGKVQKLTFFIHNFMDAKRLECDRIGGCSFMVMTPEGPISMCMHNAKRDEFILSPLTIQTEQGTQVWEPLTGIMTGIMTGQTSEKTTAHTATSCEHQTEQVI